MIPDSYLEAITAHGMEMDEGFPIPALIGVLVLTIPVAILAMYLAERTLKKPADSLK